VMPWQTTRVFLSINILIVLSPEAFSHRGHRGHRDELWRTQSSLVGKPMACI
jgi:hypothetical protein